MRVLLIHGSVGNAEAWTPVRPALEQRYEVLAPNRGGYPPGPLLERIDFERQAEELAPLLGEGAHLVGHSYGGVISLLIAAAHPELVRSLAVSEPPAFGLARGNPAADAFTADFHALQAAGLTDPAEFLARFLTAVGSATPPGNFTPALLQGARTLMVERSPAEAEPPLDELAATPFPKLVVSGAHSAAFDAVCDVLEERLGAERAVLAGAGHSVQRLGEPFNELLAGFVDRAEHA